MHSTTPLILYLCVVDVLKVYTSYHFNIARLLDLINGRKTELSSTL